MNVVHVGYPKTGTTFLQWNIFPQLKSWNFIDYHQSHATFMDLVYLDRLDYEEKLVRKRLLRVLKANTNNIASYEALTGAPFTFKGANRSEIPLRLKSLGFDKVIITIRNQTDILDSLYRQYVVQGGVMKFNDFLNLDLRWDPYIRAFNLDYLKYDRLVQCYHEVFGKDNVLVLSQEWMKHNPGLFSEKLEAVLGEKLSFEASKEANKALTNFSIGLLRRINHFTFNSQKPNQLISNAISTKTIWKLFAVVLDPYCIRFFSRRKSYLKGSAKEYIQHYYSQSNEKLAELVGEELKPLGYV